MQENQRGPRTELNDEEKIRLIEFLNRSDISHTNSGLQNHIYIGKFHGENKYKQKQYLLWPLREKVSISNGNDDVIRVQFSNE